MSDCIAVTVRCCSMNAARFSACTSSDIRMAASRLGMNRRINIPALRGHPALSVASTSSVA